MISVWHIVGDSWKPGSACTLVKFMQEGVDMEFAACRNESCPSKGHCYRFKVHEVYAQFLVLPKADRCDYYIPSRMEGKK